jgi:hypothetical protein
MSLDIDSLVGKYVKLRDIKATHKAEYDLKVAKVDELLNKVEAVLLRHFNDTGVESVRTESGTAYKSTRTSCTSADKSAFFNFLQETGEWPLADIRPGKKAIEEWKTAGNELPPGLNWSEEVVVGIRRGK